jgi:uncharacterized glyoxalase superfamily protein PhnB
VKPTPSDGPRCSSAVFYQDAAAAINWLCDAFGFEIRIKVEGKDDRIEHSELTYGAGVVMVAQEDPDCTRIVEEPATHDYGQDYWADCSYGALDPEGHMWWITQRVRNPPEPGQR